MLISILFSVYSPRRGCLWRGKGTKRVQYRSNRDWAVIFSERFRACLHGGGEPQVGEVTCFCGVKNNRPIHAVLQPRHPGVHFLKIIEWSPSTQTRKMLTNRVFWRLMHFYTPLLLLLQPSVLWLSIVNFNNNAKQPPKWILREFDVSRIRPRPGGLPHLETFTWHNLTPAERVTRSGRPGYLPWWVTPPIM